MKMIWSWIDTLARFVIRLIGKVSPKLGGLCEKLWNNTELVAYLFAGVHSCLALISHANTLHTLLTHFLYVT